jgi:DNA-binding PadR family transcriptional regulator
MFELSNVEYILLTLIRESGKASGYGLNAVIADRGYREWADIGMTSIYVGLKKLEHKGLIQGRLTTEKTVQGPAAREFSLTGEGKRLLVEETAQGLSGTRERDRRFDLAVSAMDVLSPARAHALIQKRRTFLETERKRLSAVFAGERGRISAQGTLLFKHTLNFMKSEIAFLDDLVDGLGKEAPHDH